MIPLQHSSPGEKVSKQPPQLLAWWSNRLYVEFAELFPDYSPVNLSNVRGSPIAAVPCRPCRLVSMHPSAWIDSMTTTGQLATLLGELRYVVLRQERSGCRRPCSAAVSTSAPRVLLRVRTIGQSRRYCAAAMNFSPVSDASRSSKKSSQGAALPAKVADHPGSAPGSMWTFDSLNDLKQLEAWLLPTGYREGSLKAAMRDVIEAKLPPHISAPRVCLIFRFFPRQLAPAARRC